MPRPGIIQNSSEYSGFEPGTFRSSVWRSPNWAISACLRNCVLLLIHITISKRLLDFLHCINKTPPNTIYFAQSNHIWGQVRQSNWLFWARIPQTEKLESIGYETGDFILVKSSGVPVASKRTITTPSAGDDLSNIFCSTLLRRRQNR